MKMFLFFVVFSVFAISCADTSSTGELINSCIEITCSGHGKCVSNDGIPECKCDDGYINTGSNCILDCSGIENAKVNIYNNICECELGFEELRGDGNLLTSCSCESGKVLKAGKCITECLDEHAVSTPSGQSCICDAGYINVGNICTFDCRNISNAYTNTSNDGCECEPDYEKKGDICVYQCNIAGNMVPNSSNSDCVCKTDYYQTNEVDVCETSCENISCESNSTCKAFDYESYLCQCNEERNLKLNYIDTLILEMNGNNDFQIASNNGNSYAIVWSGRTSDTNAEKSIFMAITDGNGVLIDINDGEAGLGNPFIVNNVDYDKDKLTPTVVWGGDKYAVAWEDRRYESPTTVMRDIYMRYVLEDGTLEVEKHITFTPLTNAYAYSPKLLWNSEKANFAIFWTEEKREGSGDTSTLGNAAIYFRIISSSGEFLISSKALTSVNVINYDFDVIVNQENDYSMVWTLDNSRKLQYQVINSDDALIATDGIIKKAPINLIYDNHKSNSPKLLWNGSEYVVFYKNSSDFNRNYMIMLNSNHQKIGSELYLGIIETPLDIFWNGNEYLSLRASLNDLYIRKISWNGQNSSSYMVSDGVRHTLMPKVYFMDKNNVSVFWLDTRNGKSEIYFSNLGCF